MTNLNWVFLLIIFWASPSLAEQDLSRALVESALSTSEQMAKLFKKHPEWEDAETKNMNFITDPSAVKASIAHLKKTGAFAPLTTLVKKNGFDSLEAWHNVFRRTMLSLMQTESEKTGMNFDSMSTIMETQLNQLREQGIPESVLKEQEKNIATAKQMVAAMKTVSPKDKQFVTANYDWLSEKLNLLGLNADFQ